MAQKKDVVREIQNVKKILQRLYTKAARLKREGNPRADGLRKKLIEIDNEVSVLEDSVIFAGVTPLRESTKKK